MNDYNNKTYDFKAINNFENVWGMKEFYFKIDIIFIYSIICLFHLHMKLDQNKWQSSWIDS